LSFQKGVELLKKEQNTDEKTYQAKIIHPIQKNRPKIIHAIGNIMIGGSTRLVVDLIEYLGHKYDQEVITNFVPSPAAYTGFPYHLFSEPATPEDIAAFLQERAADILHIHYWGEPWYRKVFGAARNCTCRVVENINTPLEPFVQDGIEKYIFVSNYVMNLSDAPDRSAVIYPGSDLKMFQRGGAPIPDDAIGMVYRLEEDKLMGDSIQVFIKVVKKRPQTKAYIVGGGILFDSYRNQTINEGVAENFVFTGYVAYEKLPEYYRKLSLFVAPVWSESFGQVSPFAMSMKIPVVGYNIGALPEILGSADCLRKDPTKLAELIIGLLDDRQKRIEIGTANYARACDFFSIENMIRKYDLLYSRLLK
jgi:glycosyltransferase involved in cell wall biosynthesis